MNKHSASGPMAGYTYQYERALYWLSEGNTYTVGIETDDDVVIQDYDGNQKHEQDKHALSRTAPYGDSSKSLWNTLKIWLEAVSKNQAILEKTYFLMVTNKTVSPHGLVIKISNADSEEAAKLCLEELKKTAESLSESVKPLSEAVLAHTDQEIEKLIQKITVEDATKHSSDDSLRKRIIANLHLPPNSDHEAILQELLGWIIDQSTTMWKAKQPALIEKDSFNIRYSRSQQKNLDNVIRFQAEHLLPLTDGDREKCVQSMFVNQLNHIFRDDQQVKINEAIEDYLRSKIEFSRIAKTGVTTKDDITGFFRRLTRRWSSIKDRIIETSTEVVDERAIGNVIYRETINHREIFCGQKTEEYYLTSGSYHQLANELTIGWHPKFLDLCKK